MSFLVPPLWTGGFSFYAAKSLLLARKDWVKQFMTHYYYIVPCPHRFVGAPLECFWHFPRIVWAPPTGCVWRLPLILICSLQCPHQKTGSLFTKTKDFWTHVHHQKLSVLVLRQTAQLLCRYLFLLYISFTFYKWSPSAASNCTTSVQVPEKFPSLPLLFIMTMLA